jgi:hypothetical protein
MDRLDLRPYVIAKILASMGGTQAGKFITIYANDAAHARAIVQAIDPALAGQGLRGTVIGGERPVGSSGLMHIRYGGFTKLTVTYPTGLETGNHGLAISAVGYQPVSRTVTLAEVGAERSLDVMLTPSPP